MNEFNFNLSNLTTLSPLQAQPGMDVAGAQAGVEKNSGGKDEGELLSVTYAKLAPADGLEEVPDAALTRDDDLGKRISAAFSLPPPPPPIFSD